MSPELVVQLLDDSGLAPSRFGSEADEAWFRCCATLVKGRDQGLDNLEPVDPDEPAHSRTLPATALQRLKSFQAEGGIIFAVSGSDLDELLATKTKMSDWLRGPGVVQSLGK